MEQGFHQHWQATNDRLQTKQFNVPAKDKSARKSATQDQRLGDDNVGGNTGDVWKALGDLKREISDLRRRIDDRISLEAEGPKPLEGDDLEEDTAPGGIDRSKVRTTSSPGTPELTHWTLQTPSEQSILAIEFATPGSTCGQAGIPGSQKYVIPQDRIGSALVSCPMIYENSPLTWTGTAIAVLLTL